MRLIFLLLQFNKYNESAQFSMPEMWEAKSRVILINNRCQSGRPLQLVVLILLRPIITIFSIICFMKMTHMPVCNWWWGLSLPPPVALREASTVFLLAGLESVLHVIMGLIFFCITVFTTHCGRLGCDKEAFLIVAQRVGEMPLLKWRLGFQYFLQM